MNNDAKKGSKSISGVGKRQVSVLNIGDALATDTHMLHSLYYLVLRHPCSTRRSGLGLGAFGGRRV